jgi:hypothetical protein
MDMEKKEQAWGGYDISPGFIGPGASSLYHAFPVLGTVLTNAAFLKIPG